MRYLIEAVLWFLAGAYVEFCGSIVLAGHPWTQSALVLAGTLMIAMSLGTLRKLG